ncbi:MAG: TonB-dependent receptor plug domain-containing protein [Nostoc sp.]
MKPWQLWVLISLLGCLSAVAIQPVEAQENREGRKVNISSINEEEKTSPQNAAKIPQLSEIEIPNTSARMLVQSPAPTNSPAQESVIQVTGVEAKPTDKGVEVILQTTGGDKLQITNRSAENNFIADIPNAQLRLPSGDAFTFRSEKPIAGVTEITVTNYNANTIRVTVTGEAALPTVELFDSDEGLIFGLTPTATATQPQPEQTTTTTTETPQEEPAPAAQQDEPIELVVTGEQDGYNVSDTTTATKTDTPLRDIPQSIQVVPQQVLEDQNVTRLDEAIRNVPGVVNTFPPNFANGSFLTIRGFETRDDQGNVLRNGLTDFIGTRQIDFSHIQQIEVLKGPASVLFGRGVPGGTVNLITKQPLSDPFYEINTTIGNYDYYRSTIDLSGPVNDSKTVLYRLNAAYQNTGSFIDFKESERVFVAPVVSLAISDRT